MFAVIFEVTPHREKKDEYLKIAAELKKFLENREGFISIERFESLNEKGKVLSLSFWKTEASIEKWRNLVDHRKGQARGKDLLFKDYRIRVARVVRDYTKTRRSGAPGDSKTALAQGR